MMTENIKSELKKYFSSSSFKGLLDALKNKYINYGSCIGKINITPSTKEEADKLSMFLAKNIKENMKVNIKILDIQKSLDDSKFEGILVDDLVLMFFPNIKTKKDIKRETNIYVEEIFNKYKLEYKDSNITLLFENKDAIKKINYLILHDHDLLKHVMNSLNKLPIYENRSEILPIFASKLTGNPHYYDLDTHNSNVFLQFICYLFDLFFDGSRNRKKEIFEYVGILIDEVSNFVITYNLSGNEMLDSFKDNLTPLTINLSNVQKISDIKAENNSILIVENPSFISKVNGKKINFSIIVTSGNSNLVIYRLLEKIHHPILYFNGDFDPEGLLIAQNFKNRYSNIKFIGYNEKYYKNGLSDNMINEIRIKKLKNINNKDLSVIKELLIKNRICSYQESNYDMLICDLNNMIDNNK